MPGEGWARLELTEPLHSSSHSASHSSSREVEATAEAIVFTSENYNTIKVESTKEIQRSVCNI